MKAPTLRDPIAASLQQLMGSRIRRARQERGMTQMQLAEALGSPSFYANGIISKMEGGNYSVSAVMLRILSAILDRPMSYFFDGPELDALAPGGLPPDEFLDYGADVRELLLWYIGLDEVARKSVRSYVRFMTFREQDQDTKVSVLPADPDKSTS